MTGLLVFGKTGQVATQLQARAPDAVFLGRDRVDLAQPGQAGQAIAAHAPDVVINAAAYTGVDAAETEEPLAHAVNAVAPAEMAQACAARAIPFLHISTDYVFDGSGQRPWAETDPVAPLGAYGRTKLAGEEAIRAAAGVHAILRTSWVFSAHGNNFVKTMLRLSETRDALNVVADQIGGPTAAGDIAETLLIMSRALCAGQGGGTYHYAGRPDISWAGFAREIFAQAGRAVAVRDIPTTDYPTPAKRPQNSRLNCTKLETDFGIIRPDWQRSLADVLAKI